MRPSVPYLSQQNSKTTLKYTQAHQVMHQCQYLSLEIILQGPSPFSSFLDWLLSSPLHSCHLGTSLHHQVSKLKPETQWQGEKKKKDS